MRKFLVEDACAFWERVMRLAIGLEEEEEERDAAVVLTFVERRSFLGQRLRRGDGERAIRLPTPNLESAEKIIGSARLIGDSYRNKTEMVIRPKRKALRTRALRTQTRSLKQKPLHTVDRPRLPGSVRSESVGYPPFLGDN